MCEHAGMLNHLLAKIEDLEIGAGQVVAQTAPQCFDISLWQLVSGLLVGARTLVVGQREVLDIERYVEALVDGGVEVLQVVPSYLEVMLTWVEERRRGLGRLRVVSATGEALKKELVERWFAVFPDIGLVNAYGLTETSDDTNHAVMDRVPAHDRVPLGPAVRNVRVYVVDEQLVPVPLGAPGVRSSSPGCVWAAATSTTRCGRPPPSAPIPTGQGSASTARGTSAAGSRTVRWSSWAGGTPRPRSAASASRSARSRTICCVCPACGTPRSSSWREPTGRGIWPPSTPRTFRSPWTRCAQVLGGALPAYMVPRIYHHREVLPLTGNGKIDKKVLAREAVEAASRTAEPAAPPAATPRPGRRRSDGWPSSGRGC